MIKIQNDAWSYLRDFFQPGRGREAGAPRTVSEVLSVMLDSELWIQLPRFSAVLSSSVAGVGDTPVIQLVVPDGFALTDLWVGVDDTSGANSGSCQVVALPNLQTVDLPGAIARVADSWSGVPSSVVWSEGEATAAAGPAGLRIMGFSFPAGSPSNRFQHLPNVGPGQTIQFWGDNTNEALLLNAMWTERRPLS